MSVRRENVFTLEPYLKYDEWQWFGACFLALDLPPFQNVTQDLQWKLEMELKWTMRLIFSAWFLIAVLGILFYAHYYLGII